MTAQGYIDVRSALTSEQISLDLARHLPRRLSTGPAVIITEKPALLLPVLRKRWMRIIREVERQRSSTLIREKRQALEYELQRLRSFRFSANPGNGPADVLLIGLPHSLPTSFKYSTLYVATVLAHEPLQALLATVPHEVLLVIYGSPIDFSVSLA